MFVRSRFFSLVSVVALAGSAACAAPSSFDGLSGGNGPEPTKELRARSADATIDSPRPIAPISVSMVSTLRPTLKWKTAAGSTGAIVELCKSRACDGDDVRRLDVEGETITVPDDLEPGFWYWRLYGTAKERIGTKPSATWEFVVRGPGAKGASDAPAGGIVDVNGDGFPDMIVTSEETAYDDENQKWGTFPSLNVWFGGPDGKLATKDIAILDFYAEAGEDRLAGGVDTDGDGFTDIAQAVKDRTTGEYVVWVAFGGPGKAWELDGAKGFDFLDFTKQDATVLLPGLKTLPSITSGGDVNGDGYGDMLVASPTTAVVGLGSGKGTSVSMPLVAGIGSRGTNAVVGAFDADGDGLSDVAFASVRAGSPISAARGDRDRIGATTDLMTANPGLAEKAIVVASGDFDGDGMADLAATVPIEGRRYVCFWLASRTTMFTPSTCIEGLNGDDSYGNRLTAADLEGKGRDELLVTGGERFESSRGGAFVEAIGFDGEMPIIDRIDQDGIGKQLTTIWPGRPGKAKWATVDATGSIILVFEGRTVFQTIPLIGRFGSFAKTVHSIR